jgi:hypothetical protein
LHEYEQDERAEIEHSYQWHHPADRRKHGLYQVIERPPDRVVRIHEVGKDYFDDHQQGDELGNDADQLYQN